MVVDFIIKPKIMKDNLLTNIYANELKAFEEDIKKGKIFVKITDDDAIKVEINDKKLEKEFIDGFKKRRERLSMKVLERICSLKVLQDNKELKLW
jgi:hypothetical protein